jgi:hypothetical protein
MHPARTLATARLLDRGEAEVGPKLAERDPILLGRAESPVSTSRVGGPPRRVRSVLSMQVKRVARSVAIPSGYEVAIAPALCVAHATWEVGP